MQQTNSGKTDAKRAGSITRTLHRHRPPESDFKDAATVIAGWHTSNALVYLYRYRTSRYFSIFYRIGVGSVQAEPFVLYKTVTFLAISQERCVLAKKR